MLELIILRLFCFVWVLEIFLEELRSDTIEKERRREIQKLEIREVMFIEGSAAAA